MSRIFANICRSGLKYRSCLHGLQQSGRTALVDPLQSSSSSVRLFHVSSAARGSAGEGFHRCSPFDKKILAWTNMFPSLAAVPDEVTSTKMKKAKDMFRIRVNIMMALGTVVLCVIYVILGKRAVGRGESVSQQNRDRHSSYQKES